MELTVIILVLAFIASNSLTAFITFKGVQIGLKWNKQVSEGQEPTLNGPIASTIEKIEQKKVEKEVQQQTHAENMRLQDWIGNPDYLEAYKPKKESEE